MTQHSPSCSRWTRLHAPPSPRSTLPPLKLLRGAQESRLTGLLPQIMDKMRKDYIAKVEEALGLRDDVMTLQVGTFTTEESSTHLD